jgi:hypothetical protein
MRSVASRLQRIEASLPRKPPPRPLSEADIQCWDTFESLLRKMDPDHANLLERELKLRAEARDRGIQFKINSLLFAAFRCVTRHLEISTPLVMPAEVAAIYISNPDLGSWHECEDCGYELPFQRAQPSANPPRPETIYFARCPLCGGRVSWCAFSIKQSRKKLEAAERDMARSMNAKVDGPKYDGR